MTQKIKTKNVTFIKEITMFIHINYYCNCVWRAITKHFQLKERVKISDLLGKLKGLEVHIIPQLLC